MHPVNLSVRAEDEIPVADSTGHRNQPALLFAASLTLCLDKGNSQTNDFCAINFW